MGRSSPSRLGIPIGIAGLGRGGEGKDGYEVSVPRRRPPLLERGAEPRAKLPPARGPRRAVGRRPAGGGGTPGDATADQMDAVAAIAERFGHDEIRVSHEQNLILPHVAETDLRAVYDGLVTAELATANAGFITDIIACPGLDYCALANACSIPVAQRISQRFGDIARQREIGDLKIKISGCINACGHHHVGHIGILGVDKAGEEWYQVTIGGRQNGAAKPLPDIESTRGGGAAIGRIIGPSFARDQVPGVVDRLIRTYLGLRDSEEERFIDVVDRVGIEPFKQDVYADPAFAKPQAQEAAHV